jgi:choice-of-anchor B domain-containing protein
MKKIILFAILFNGFITSQAQPHFLIDSVSSLDISQNYLLNEVWGYVDSNGAEYALVGRQDGFSVVSLADTLNPVQVYSDTGTNTIWRDIKTWQNYAYVISEAPEGLEIYDLSYLPDSVVKRNRYNGDQYTFQSAHNLFVDDSARLFLFGSNYFGGSYETIILDLSVDPEKPLELGYYEDSYLHDGYARGDTLYGSAVNDGELQIIDISDPLNPVVRARQTTPASFTHNAWLSDDGNTIFTTDEVRGGFITAYDVSQQSGIPELDRIRSRERTDVIPHNTHFYNDFLVTSYYTLGVSIVDASRPDHLVEVGYFDTSPNYNGGTFDGNWGAYPYLPSGLLLLSDRQEGLIVVRPKYQKASFLSGRVIDCNQNVIDQVGVEVLGTSLQTKTNLVGSYELGAPINGFYQVRFSREGYNSRIIDSVLLSPGQLNNLQVELLDSNAGYVSMVYNSMQNHLNGVIISAQGESQSYTDTTNALGISTLRNIAFGVYDIKIGAWGLENKCFDNYNFNCENDSSLYIIDSAYEDNFNQDLGWVVSGNETAGAWLRDKPIGTVDRFTASNPSEDDYEDCGDFAYLTGNGFGDAEDFDVDSTTVLTSPPMNLNNYLEPYLVFNTWFYCGGEQATDFLQVNFIDTADNVIPVDTINNESQGIYWQARPYKLADFMDKAAFSKVQFIVEDNGMQNILEAGIDHFFISEGEFIGLSELAPNENQAKLFPNPFHETLSFEFEKVGERKFLFYNVSMQLLKEEQKSEANFSLNTSELPQGLIILQIIAEDGQVQVEKIVKQ